MVGAIAGVMGAEGSEVTAETDGIILESAIFDSIKTRQATKQLGLRSESSNRFEKGVDVAQLSTAVNRVIQLLSSINGDDIAIYEPVIEGNHKLTSPSVTIDLAKVNSFLGTNYW